MIDLNKFDIAVAKKEGKKIQVNIGQIKEVRRCVLEELAGYSDRAILELIYTYRGLTKKKIQKGG